MVVEATRVRQYPMVGSFALRRRERRVCALVVATQHIREALVVENLDGRPNNADRLTAGPVREIKPTQAIVGDGKTDPGHGVARMLLDGETACLRSAATEAPFVPSVGTVYSCFAAGRVTCAGLQKTP